MPRMTREQYAAYIARREPPTQARMVLTDIDLEEDLHNFIIGWCKRQDPPVPYGHARMDKKSSYTEGFPDFVLFLPGDRTLLVECKTEKGELEEKQREFANNAALVGHVVHVVRSYQEFLEVARFR